MKRFLMLGGITVLCGVLIGCNNDTYEGLIDDTISRIEVAAVDVGNIRARVNDAVKNYEDGVKEGKTLKLDLSDAIKSTDSLKLTGEKSLDIKRRIEQIRASVTDAQRKSNAESKKSRMNEVVKNLLQQKEQLRQALDTAEKVNPPSSKTEVDALRKKIVDAESPFESIARQQ